MHSVNAAESMRRSSRVPITLPIAVTSLEPTRPFSEILACEAGSRRPGAISQEGWRRDHGSRGRLQTDGRRPTGLAGGCEAGSSRKFLGTGSLSCRLGTVAGDAFGGIAIPAKTVEK